MRFQFNLFLLLLADNWHFIYIYTHTHSTNRSLKKQHHEGHDILLAYYNTLQLLHFPETSDSAPHLCSSCCAETKEKQLIQEARVATLSQLTSIQNSFLLLCHIENISLNAKLTTVIMIQRLTTKIQLSLDLKMCKVHWKILEHNFRTSTNLPCPPWDITWEICTALPIS